MEKCARSCAFAPGQHAGANGLIRSVDLSKAVIAGAAGALAMELVSYPLRLAGVATVDLAAELGSVLIPHLHVVGALGGLLAHACVGLAWALYYAYFFWGRFKWPRLLQGLAFATLPALLAILVVYPQLKLMQAHADIVRVRWGDFAQLSPGQLASIIVSHAAFGLVIGWLYQKPVGYPVHHRPPAFAPLRHFKRAPDRGRKQPTGFMFATGIECSYPTIENGRWRRDELASTLHYKHWQRDFDLCRQLGVTHLRYGPPLHLTFLGPGKYDWSWADEPMAELEKYGPEPIVDLCHFGVPDWLGNLQNPELPAALAEYADAFAQRYPWVRFYTPVNEMYVCSRLSALEGDWNEQEQSDSAFVTAAFHLASASIGMTDAILKRRPDAIFINSESSEFTQPCCPDPDVQQLADMENERRFLPLDLIYAHKLSDQMKSYLHDHGKSDEHLARFNHREVPRRSILGLDYYEWNERLVDTHGRIRALGELFGWYVIAKQYYDRYQRPLMHTETNRMGAEDAPQWLWRQWHNVQLMRKSGVPLVGFTWYSLTDQIDWTIALTEALGLVFPVGLFDLNRDVRSVGLAYKQLIEMFADVPEFRDCQDLAKVIG
jgi:beta-glucosidase/6-phospho-beta-glucosidase/beta-galactosidase